MRDPNRINKFCDELKAIWGQVPDWRFGQLICNAINAWNITQKCHAFYAEDEDFIGFLFEYISKEARKNDDA